MVVVWRCVLGVVLVLLTASSSVEGQEGVVPPTLESEAQVDYPHGGQGRARVVLELTISKEGRVQNARVVQGQDPFAATAVQAARGWRFEPARRGDEPVAARVRFEVVFDPPVEAEPEEVQGPAPATAASASQSIPIEEPQEVRVTGERPATGQRAMSRAEARQLPGAFGDPFRAIEVMPGVAPVHSGIPFFFVRGAPPGNVGYYIDGVRVPLLYHLGLGPSVVNPGLVERVELHPGGYPARYGRYVGGIVTAETTAPRSDFHGEASVRLLDAGGFVESGFDEGRGSVTVGGRYSYTGLALTLASPDINLQYWDYQARVSYDLDAKNTVGLFAFGAFDFIGEVNNGVMERAFETHFHRVDLRWGHRASARTEIDLAATFGNDRSYFGEDDLASLDRLVGTRGRLRHRASDDAQLRAGYDFQVDWLSFDNEEDEDYSTDFKSRRDAALGVWLDAVLDVDPRVVVTPGLRSDLFLSGDASAVGVDPRIAALFKINDDLRTTHTLGLAHQPPSFGVPLPGLVPTGLEDGLQRSVQWSSGVEVDLPEKVTAKATLYQSAFFNMTDFARDDLPLTEEEEEFAEGSAAEEQAEDKAGRNLGHSVGLELSLSRPLSKRVGGYASYTLSRSTRSYRRSRTPSEYDRTHVANLALGYDLGRKWRVGTRAVFMSGIPSSRFNSKGVRPTYPKRLPPFFRLDFRLEKRWKLGDRGYWAFVFEVQNATLSTEPLQDNCDEDGCKVEYLGPVTIPSIGVEAFF